VNARGDLVVDETRIVASAMDLTRGGIIIMLFCCSICLFRLSRCKDFFYEYTMK